MYLTYSKSLPSFDQHMVHLEFDMPDSSKVHVGFHEGFVALAAKYYEAFYSPVEEVKVEESIVEEVKVEEEAVVEEVKVEEEAVVEEVKVEESIVEEVKVEEEAVVEEVKVEESIVEEETVAPVEEEPVVDVAPVVAPTPVAKKSRKANV
jgi:hypothetical protein